MEELPTRNGKHCKRAVQASRSLKQKARLRKKSNHCSVVGLMILTPVPIVRVLRPVEREEWLG